MAKGEKSGGRNGKNGKKSAKAAASAKRAQLAGEEWTLENKIF